MSERVSKLVSFTVGIAITLPVLFLVTAWDFRTADIVVALVFVLGVAVGVWATRVWYSVGRRS